MSDLGLRIEGWDSLRTGHSYHAARVRDLGCRARFAETGGDGGAEGRGRFEAPLAEAAGLSRLPARAPGWQKAGGCYEAGGALGPAARYARLP